jgi:hypothetical protein
MSGRTNTRSIPQKISAVVGIHRLARFSLGRLIDTYSPPSS